MAATNPRARRQKVLLFISRHHFRERVRRNDWLTLGANVSPMGWGGVGGGGVGEGVVGGAGMKNHRRSKCRYCGGPALSPALASIRHCPPAGPSLSGPRPGDNLISLRGADT